MRKYCHLWIILILIGVTSCRDRVIERPIAVTLSTPAPFTSALQTPTFSSPILSVLPTPFVPTATIEAEQEITPTPFVTSMPINTVVLTPTPVYTVTSVNLPRECYEILPEDTQSWGKLDFQPCSNFETSPDGRFLGFFFGPDLCGRGIIILDTQTDEMVYRSGLGQGLGIEFLENGKVLLTTGHCEGGQMSLFDPATKHLSGLGGLGSGGWNTSRTAIAVETGPYQGIGGVIWGYNVERDFLFLPQVGMQGQLDHHLLWTPEGSHILFLHRPVSYTLESNTYVFSEAQSIIRVNAATGEKQVRVSDSRYDYHFCAGAYNWCDRWYGDWIQVRRFPFEPQNLVYTDDFYYLPAVTCLLYGMDCNESPDLFALNWRTGELVPWSEGLPSMYTPIPAQPNTGNWFIP